MKNLAILFQTMAMVVLMLMGLIPGIVGVAHAQESLPVNIDFTGFAGNGFASDPSTGQLDSDSWIVKGLSDGDGTFGEEYENGDVYGDFIRGESPGGVSSGGVYAFDVGDGNLILGIQPMGTDFTPGEIILRIQNNTGSTVTKLDISYDMWHHNDQNRANFLNFAYSSDNSAYTDVSEFNFTTPEAADASPIWQSEKRSTLLSGLSIADDGFFYLRWQGDDVSGSGSRDEYGIDNVRVIVPPPEIFISEYIEGTSYNKAIELYNPTGADIDLSAGTYSLELYSDGDSTASQSLELTGIIPADDVFVLAHPSAGDTILAIADVTDASVINFNGDDAVVLRKNSTIIDVIGKIGKDPGTQWGSGDISTQNKTIRRKPDITSGDADPDDAFDPSVEWEGFPQDTFEGLGCHPAASCSGITRIHTIQGSSTTSPELGNTHTIKGIVVGDFQDTSDGLGGFFVQEEDADADTDTATSEGIFVYNHTADVNVGDQVQVTGTVQEYASDGTSLTQISSVTEVTLLSSGNPLPSAASVSLPVTDVSEWERYEGMRVSMSQTLYVTSLHNLGTYGEVSLSSDGRVTQFTHANTPDPDGYADHLAETEKRRIILDDAKTSVHPDPIIHPSPGVSASHTLRGGDSVSNLTGILDDRFGKYRIQPTKTIDFTPANPRPVSPSVDGRLRVASMNLLNYFDGSGGDVCGPSGNQECWGADNADEFTRQRDKTISAIITSDADIIGLMELENDSTSLQNLVDGINAVAGADAYNFIDTGIIGTNLIRVAMIYKASTVSAVGDYAILDRTAAPSGTTFYDNKNRPSLAQTFQETETGEIFTVVVSHLISKRSSCDESPYNDPDQSDGQGKCNGVRTKAAQALAAWIETDPTDSGDADILIIGDMNSYAREDPITSLIKADYTDLIAKFSGANAYSYVHDGQWGYLDHALSGECLTPQVAGASVWHINADEPELLDYNTENKSSAQISDLYNDDPYRASDHDPIVVGLNLGAAPSVRSVTPLNHAVNVPVNTDITIAFSEPVSVSGEWFQIVAETSGTRTVSDTVVSGGPTNWRIRPDTDFANGESVTITIFASKVADQDSTEDHLAEDYTWSFDMYDRDLFISEYVEGGSNDKAIELYNCTGSDIDLDSGNYMIEMYFNGKDSPDRTIALKGIVEDSSVFVIANSKASFISENEGPLSADQVDSNSIWFTGDDTVILRKGGPGGTILDVFGQLGYDPGDEWGSGLTSTMDNTLRRKSAICHGDRDPSDPFDPAAEWEGFANNTFDGLGAHTASCEPPDAPPESPIPNSACTDIILSGLTVVENQPVGTYVGTLSAVDPDPGDSHTFYRVVHIYNGWMNNNAFILERDGIIKRPYEGNILRTDEVFDYEKQNSYGIYIRCNDSTGGSCFKVFTLTVIDINEPPTGLALSYRWVDEELPAGTEVGFFTTLGDPDADETSSYTLVPGEGSEDNGLFSIRENILRTGRFFDYETEEKHDFNIRVRTSDKGGLNYEQCFTVILKDLNEPPTAISLNCTEVDENLQPPVTAVGTFSTEDINPDDHHTYTLVPGEGDADNELFRITGSTLCTRIRFDHEEKESYTIRVRTDDGHGGIFATHFNITVNDLNEPPALSAIPDQTANFSIAGDTDTHVAAFTISDPETPAAHLTLSAESSDPELMPPENIAFTGSGTARDVTLSPMPGISGTVIITVIVSDGELSVSTDFTLTVIRGPVLEESSVEPAYDPDTPLFPGDALTYAAVIPNTGDQKASHIVFTLSVPENTSYVPDSLDARVVRTSGDDEIEDTEFPVPAYNNDLNQIEWVGDIPAGVTVEIRFDVCINGDVQAGAVIPSPRWRIVHDPDGDGVSDAVAEYDETGDSEKRPPICIEIPDTECLRGDMNNNDMVDLSDAVLVLQILTQMREHGVSVCADVNSDGRVGMEEVIYIMRKISG
ncbi:ExeM/NucH family extracellular endonuclease [Desulfonema magnum]|uniref:Cadherin and dockerin domain-containing protein n=1 Tax=Desulfonema magnum TaxID=45655 RepID=A0A975BRT6_9BACT|nr:ExeM/NucH family extracellular endonuclease [Desulfonema magnum]QTA90511.1 Cadherin and dockerin domain-containing protein [Desulfonema magnum]